MMEQRLRAAGLGEQQEHPTAAPGPIPSWQPLLNDQRQPQAALTPPQLQQHGQNKHPDTSDRKEGKTQTAERKEREKGVEREVQKWASSTACKEQGEKHRRGDAQRV